MAYLFGLLIERFREKDKISKLLLTLSASGSLAMLGYFKYGDFLIGNFNEMTGLSVPLLRMALPIGISFYTFQILSYTVDIYRGKVAAQRNLIDFAAYVAFFPQLIAGPIVRYSDVANQLKSRTHSLEGGALGVRRFILGLGKKVLIADLLGELCSIFRESDDKSVLFFWLYAVADSLYIYFDFSGYSDMAIGLGKIFGFRFPENFHYPYISASIREFWQRLRREGLKSRLVLQIHDELLVEAARDEVEQVSRIMRQEMEGAAELSVALEVDLHTGETWFDAK